MGKILCKIGYFFKEKLLEFYLLITEKLYERMGTNNNKIITRNEKLSECHKK